MEKTDVRESELMDENAMTGGEEQLLEISADLIRGHINTIILRTLYDEDKYGYDIMDEIERKSGGLYKLKPPTLYSALKRLESLGYVDSYAGEFSNGGRRKYFHLTEQGREVAKRNLSEWEFSRTIIDSLISDGGAHYDFSFIAEKQTELEELKRSLAARETALEAEKSALASLKNELQRERSLLATQNADLSSKRNDLGEFNDKIQAQKEELAAQALALSEKEGELAAKELALQEKQTELHEAQETIRSLEASLTNATKEVEEYQSAARAQADELKETESALLSLQQEYSAIRLELLTLRQNQTTNTAQLDQIESLQTQLQEKENRLASLEKSLQDKENDLEKRETALASAQLELSEKNAASYELLSKISSDQLRLESERSEFEQSKLAASTAEDEKMAQLSETLSQKNEELQSVYTQLQEKRDLIAQLTETTESLKEQLDSLRDERDAYAEKTEALERQKVRLEEEKAEIEAFAAEIERKERALNEKLLSYDLDESRTIADKEQFAKEQLSLAEQQEQTKRLSEQLRYEQELLKQRQAELTTRLELFNQQQLDYLAKKQALTLQQFENEDKYATHTAQVKHLNDTMMAFETEKSAFTAEKTAFEEERKAFEAEKAQFREEKRRAAESNRVFVDSLNAKEDAFRREEARLQALSAELDRRAAEYNAQPRTPAYSPAAPAYDSAYYASGNSPMDELYKRAERDGIRLNSRTAPQRSPAAAYAKPAKPTPTFNKGATLFKAALLTFCFLAVECIIVFFMKDTLGVPFFYPLIPLAVGLVFFAICSILYASGYQSNAKLNKKSAGYIFSAVILFVVGIITASMVAVYCRAPLAQPTALLSFIVLPAIFLTNLILYPVFYHFFAISNENKEPKEEE